MRKIFMFLIAAMAFASCTTPVLMGDQYAKMYEEKPLTIAIMPPINQTTHAEAKDYFYTTLYQPLCEKGYYVFSPYLTMEMFQQESAYDAEMFLEGDVSTFGKVLGADAVMFTIIKDWKRKTALGYLDVNIEYVLRSTKTGEILYNREGDIRLDTSINAGSSGLGALVSLVATAVNTAVTDKVIAGRRCNAYVLTDLPAGKYSPSHGVDSANPAGKKIFRAMVK
ncbi:MAG: DUF799 family lipoprotein [Bacteroidaceae bacterium]|nr:DUF799 family lipoprotein [Bacteroidaceae bacterium]